MGRAEQKWLIRFVLDFLCCRIEMFENVLSQQLEDVALQQLSNWKQKEAAITQEYSEKKE
jgi:hypothetical protein